MGDQMRLVFVSTSRSSELKKFQKKIQHNYCKKLMQISDFSIPQHFKRRKEEYFRYRHQSSLSVEILGGSENCPDVRAEAKSNAPEILQLKHEKLGWGCVS